jgi:RDD family
MNCEKCGDVCRCPAEPPPIVLASADSIPAVQAVEARDAAFEVGTEVRDLSDSAWRSELSARLHRYRARRKPPPPRYPSLRLPFGGAEPPRVDPVREIPPAHVFPGLSSPALALDGFHQPPAPIETERQPQAREPVSSRAGSHSGAKIIEFPRFAWAPPPPPLDQLAEPVIDRPRILEVPEVQPPAPALGGITIEPACVVEKEKLPGIDIPLQSAPVSRRIFAGLVDGLVVAAASALFGSIFWKVTAIRPPLWQLLALGAAIPSLFWAAYQYLLVVYAANTPGLFLARLELKRFNGNSANRSLRRWRVLAAWLSAASLGMGYAWLFLDEDALCWHDRTTHTYLAPKARSLRK